MALQFLGGDTGTGGSPRLYRNGNDFFVQGYSVTDPEVLRQLKIPTGETRGPGAVLALEIPAEGRS